MRLSRRTHDSVVWCNFRTKRRSFSLAGVDNVLVTLAVVGCPIFKIRDLQGGAVTASSASESSKQSAMPKETQARYIQGFELQPPAPEYI